MVDRRPPGFNVDIGFSDSKEVMSIPRRHRAAAIGVWTLCGSWSANKLQDGFVPAEVLKDKGATPAIIAALIASTLWIPADADGIQFEGWPKWQRTRDEVNAYRQQEAARGRRRRNAAKASATGDDPETSARTPDGPIPDVHEDYREPETKTETETKGGDLSAVGTNARPGDDPPPRTCSRHPDGTDRPCGACANARRNAEEADNAATLAAADDRQARLDGIADCDICDDAGWAVDDQTDGVFKCEHPEPRRHATG